MDLSHLGGKTISVVSKKFGYCLWPVHSTIECCVFVMWRDKPLGAFRLFLICRRDASWLEISPDSRVALIQSKMLRGGHVLGWIERR